MTASSTLTSPLHAKEKSNPFIEISRLGKMLIIIYFLAWRFFPLLVELVHSISELSLDYISSICLKVAIQSLLLFPFLTKSFGGKPIGWLHPFVFPVLISICLSWLRSPGQILEPIFIIGSQSSFSHPLIGNWSLDSIRQVQLKDSAISLLSLLSTYIGFIWCRFYFKANIRIPKKKNWLIAVIAFSSIALIIYFLQQNGGILNYMATLAGSRFTIRISTGPFLVINNFLPYLFIFWYFYNPKIIKNKLFVILFFFVCLLQFVVTGSRSGIFVPIAAFVAAYSLRCKTLYFGRFLSLGLIAFIFLGALADIRRSGLEGQVSFDALLNPNIAEQWEVTQQDLEKSSHGTNLSVAALVPERVSYLYGNSYISSVAFWIPRFIWQDKPRGIGAHVAALLYGGRTSMDGFEGASFPVGASSESYWNFSWPGVALIFFVYGCLVKLICNLYLYNQGQPVSDTLFILLLFGFSSPSSEAIVPFQQNVILLLLIVFILKASFAQVTLLGENSGVP